MIQTKLLQVDGQPERTVKILSRKTNQHIVTETRAAAPFRALPRPVRDRVTELEASKAFLVRYQDLVDKYVSTVRCWKCGRAICAYQPVLRPVEGKDTTHGTVTVLTRLNGHEMLLGSMLPFNHYREGLFAYRDAQQRAAAFSYLHCADCQIQDADGPALLACLLGQFDHRRDHLKAVGDVGSDDSWAQYLFGWSGIELVGKQGPSLSPGDLMKGNS